MDVADEYIGEADEYIGEADEYIGEADEYIGEADEYIRIRLIQERVLCQPTLFSTPIYW